MCDCVYLYLCKLVGPKLCMSFGLEFLAGDLSSFDGVCSYHCPCIQTQEIVKLLDSICCKYTQTQAQVREGGGGGYFYYLYYNMYWQRYLSMWSLVQCFPRKFVHIIISVWSLVLFGYLQWECEKCMHKYIANGRQLWLCK